jgi:hypothetical protein
MRALSGIFLFSLISFLSTAENYSLFEENGKVGLKNQQGQIIIPAEYDALGWSDGSFSVIDRTTGFQLKGFWGLLTTSNHKITKAEFTNLVPGDGSLLVAYKKIGASPRGIAGCINTSGKIVIPFEYDQLRIASLRAIAVNRIGNIFKYGLLDLTNKKLIPVEYRQVRSIGSLRYAVENFQRKTALFSETGAQITSFSIDSISSFYKNYAVIYQDLHQGLMNRDGQIKIEPIYRAIEIQEDGTVRAKQSDEWYFLDGQNQLLQKVLCDSIEGIGKNIFKLTNAGAVRLVNEQLIPITTRTFSSLGKFKNGKAIFRQDNRYGIIRMDGVVEIEPLFNALKLDVNSLIGSKRSNGKDQWTLLDSTGSKKHTKVYEKIESFNGKFHPAKNHNRWGALDVNGKEIIACVHDSLLQNKGKNIAVKFHGQYGIIDISEEWIVIPLPNPIQLISENRYLEFTPQTTLLRSIDRNIIYFTNNKLEVFDNYLIEHLSSGGLWKIDFDGKIVSRQVQPEFVEKVFTESEGLRAIKKDNRYGFIDSRGRLRIANRYEDAQSFSEKLAAIKIRGKWGFINHEEKLIVQPTYQDVRPFQYGVSIVKQKDLYGAINTEGKVILYPRYHNIQSFANRRLRITLDELKGLSDSNGNLLIGPKFNQLEDLNNGYVIVERNAKYSLLTLQGVSTIPMIYDYLTYDKFNNRYLALKKSTWAVIKF